jgi:hypothetical protein
VTRDVRPRRHILAIDVLVPEPDPLDLGPQVRFLVDGEDYLADMFEGVGCDPDDLIGQYSPLRPDGVPRDAAVMRCGCGVTDCSLLVINVRREGDDVVWDDFRVGPGMDPVGLAPIEANTLRFDAAGYLAELDRAHADRAWEPPWRTTGRLAWEALTASVHDIEALGYRLKKVWHYTTESGRHALGVELYELRGTDRRQVVLSFGTEDCDPAKMTRTILDEPSAAWPVEHLGAWITD